MKSTLLTILRNKTTDIQKFRHAADQLGVLLAAQAGEQMATKSVEITTPFAKSKGVELKHDIILAPILRSGIALLKPFLDLFPKASVGFVGLKRNEQTAVAEQYYCNIPPITDNTFVIVLDPMIATGGSGSAALKILVDKGVPEERILFVAVITSKPGIVAVEKAFPKIKIIYAGQDPELNDQKFIVPGLGDFGDRYFGTET